MRATRTGGTISRPGTEWFLYQTLIGAWPIDAERLKQYMQKAMREAKVRTSWVANNAEYEDALEQLHRRTARRHAASSAELEASSTSINYAGRVNSLAQTLLKHTAPGVPDLYQGGELWDFSLVDPDNRRPVDYELRRRLLARVARPRCRRQIMAAHGREGLPKLWLIHQALAAAREKHPEWFGAEAAYTPVVGDGTCKRARHRLSARRQCPDGGSALERTRRRRGAKHRSTCPQGTWTNRLTGETLRRRRHEYRRCCCASLWRCCARRSGIDRRKAVQARLRKSA